MKDCVNFSRLRFAATDLDIYVSQYFYSFNTAAFHLIFKTKKVLIFTSIVLKISNIVLKNFTTGDLTKKN